MKTYKVTIDDQGTIRWYNEQGQRHREDGPAIVTVNGYKAWWLNDQCHREDGPAIENVNGYKAWYRNDQRHREDGPAIEFADGDKAWYLNDVEYTEEEFNQKMTENNSILTNGGSRKTNLTEMTSGRVVRVAMNYDCKTDSSHIIDNLIYVENPKNSQEVLVLAHFVKFSTNANAQLMFACQLADQEKLEFVPAEDIFII